ncbi:hypothetical protein [uncultured Tenacibaculum sp.]|uniref:hypothetical protein n=1 Tax=uncultured Tenacibaculum sp. TaxID=174713 RepID=UPI002627471E|nr:hypothetical protein [uncultured Tenacibaculum sp.]
MKLKITLLFLLCLVLNAFTQNLTPDKRTLLTSFNKYEKGKVELNNGEVIYGLVKITDFSNVKFKKDKKSKVVTYALEDFKKVKRNLKSAFFSKKTKNGHVLVQKIIDGSLSVYYKIRYKSMNSQLGLTVGGIGVGTSPGVTYREYYIQKNEDEILVEIPSNYKRKKFRKVLTKLTSDCTNFPLLIKNKKEIEGNFLEEEENKEVVVNIVNYYNEKCK